MLKGLQTVVFSVTDLEKAKAWYTNMLGIQPYFDEPFYVGFDVGGYELGLHPEETNGSVTYWGVEDVEAAYASLLAQGATQHREIADVGEGIKLGSVLDPEGNVVGMIYNPHFAPGGP